MSTTVSTYLNSIPTTAPEYALAQQILGKIAAAAPGGYPAAASARTELPGLLGQLLSTVIANGRLPAATVFALVAAAAPAGSPNIGDIGVSGTLSVSGSAITLSPLPY